MREDYSFQRFFRKFREDIVGGDLTIRTPIGVLPLVYMDTTASGRPSKWVEQQMLNHVLPYTANVHSETSTLAQIMTEKYHEARRIIKRHAGAGKSDILIAAGSGMTGAVARLQQILGLVYPQNEREAKIRKTRKKDRPVVFITSLEHHSNQTSWEETIAEVVIIPNDEDGFPDLDQLESLLLRYKNRKVKIGAFTDCSNVTGIRPPVHKMAALMHRYGGLCFVDFAASAPYVRINMHPAKFEERLDAIMFSPHKFAGGQGTCGILIVNSALITSPVPVVVGGGTVNWTNPWHGKSYIANLEDREDGGTPPFLQLIKASLAIKLKEKMGIERIGRRKKVLLQAFFRELDSVPRLEIMAGNIRHREAIVSFTIAGIHYRLVEKLFNDRFGVQVRGGCFCAGTYGHLLFNMGREESAHICQLIDSGDLSKKPGMVRVSLHQTNTLAEVKLVGKALRQIVKNHREWAAHYRYNKHSNTYAFVGKRKI